MKTFEQLKDIKDLRIGDIVRGKSNQISYVVTGNYGTHVTAVRSQDITNVSEWEVIRDINP